MSSVCVMIPWHFLGHLKRSYCRATVVEKSECAELVRWSQFCLTWCTVLKYLRRKKRCQSWLHQRNSALIQYASSWSSEKNVAWTLFYNPQIPAGRWQEWNAMWSFAFQLLHLRFCCILRCFSAFHHGAYLRTIAFLAAQSTRPTLLTLYAAHWTFIYIYIISFSVQQTLVYENPRRSSDSEILKPTSKVKMTGNCILLIKV